MTKQHPGVEQYRPGRWRARGWDPVAGKRILVPGGPFTSEREAWVAKCKLEKLEDEQDALLAEYGRDVPARRRRRGAATDQLIGECVTLWIDERVRIKKWKSPVTEETNRCHQRRIVAYFGELAIDKLDAEAVWRWTADLAAEGLAANTRKARLSVLTRSLNGAVAARLIEANPAAGVKIEERVARMRPDRRRIKEWELQRLLAAMPAWLDGALLLAHDAGLREEEVCGLRWANVHLDPEADAPAPWVHVADVLRKDGSEDTVTKNRKTRDVDLSPRTVEALRRLRKAYPPDDLGCRVFRTPQSPRHAANDRCPIATMQNAWTSARTRSRLAEPQPRFHDLRHAFGTRLVEAGSDIEVVRELMGHADLKTTQLYINTAPKRRRRDAIMATFGDL